MAARTQTIDFLISRMEKATDSESDAHLTSAEKFEIMNSAIAETWDVICSSGLGEKYAVAATDFPTVAGTLQYPLFTAAGTFYRINSVYVVEAGNHLRALRHVQPQEIQSFTPPTAVTTIRMYYIPYSPVLTTGQTFDGINGWEEHTLMTACLAVKAKKDEDGGYFYKRKKELEGRIKSMGNVDFGEPPRISRKRRTNNPYALLLNSSNINAYTVRGDKLELMSYNGYIT